MVRDLTTSLLNDSTREACEHYLAMAKEALDEQNSLNSYLAREMRQNVKRIDDLKSKISDLSYTLNNG